MIKTVSSGCRGIGRQVSEVAQDDPSNISTLLGDVLGSGRGRGRSIGRRDVDLIYLIPHRWGWIR